MADTNTYISKQKVEKWTTKDNFNKLGNLTEIETGTEYNLTGAIDETDLGSDLQTKINGKLTAPATPTADSAVIMLADGTVGTKPLSEIRKLYMHRVSFVFENDAMYVLTIDIPTNTNNDITLDFLRNYISGYCVVNYNGSQGIGAVSLSHTSGNNIVISGSVCDLNANNNVNISYGNKDGLAINSQILIEL